MVLVDVDHFKAINDLRGQAEGDRVLVALAGLLRSHAAHVGMVARYGGEEFAIVLPQVTGDIASNLCEYLRSAARGWPATFRSP